MNLINEMPYAITKLCNCSLVTRWHWQPTSPCCFCTFGLANKWSDLAQRNLISNRSVEKIHSVRTINNVETSYFTQRKMCYIMTSSCKQSRRDHDVRRTSKHSSSSSRMRVIYHNWSATKQRPHPQSVAEISRHSGDRIWQCETSSGSRHKDTDQCL